MRIISAYFDGTEIESSNGGKGKVDVVIDYDPREPIMITVSISEPGAAPVVWVMGRELLEQAIRGQEPDRLADAQFRATPEAILLKLDRHDGMPTATMKLDVETVADFLKRTYELVPAGDEDLSYLTDSISEFLAKWPDIEER